MKYRHCTANVLLPKLLANRGLTQMTRVLCVFLKHSDLILTPLHKMQRGHRARLVSPRNTFLLQL